MIESKSIHDFVSCSCGKCSVDGGLAEINAIGHKPMYMKDYVEQLDAILLSGNRKLLAGYGKVSHDQAVKGKGRV